MGDLEGLQGSEVLPDGQIDVATARERARLHRVGRLALVLWLLFGWMAIRLFWGQPLLPHVDIPQQLIPSLLIVVMLGSVLVIPMLAAGRSPHVLYRPSDIDIGVDDVVGADVVREEVVRTLNLFLAHQTVQDRLGATPRRGVLFEGPPGTGKTHMAKAMAREANVPFLFVASSSFQSMYYGQTNRKIRSYFRALRTAARREGGAIGFIEEIDAIGSTRSGMGSSTGREGISGVVNELLIQLQSFDEPTTGVRIKGWMIERLNAFLPSYLTLHKPRSSAANVLIVAATNRASDLDPALLRPGRFDRTIHFDLPGRDERRALVDYFLARKAHAPSLDRDRARDDLAAATMGYSPVMIEHLFDEALVWALRRGGDALDGRDIQQAKMTEELGLGHPITYTDEEKLRIATHEAGHATVAYLCGREEGSLEPIRRLEVLSIDQASWGARRARSCRRGRALHADAHRTAVAHPDRIRRDGGRGARVRRGRDRSLGRPRGRDSAWLRRWSARSAWPDRCCRSTPPRVRWATTSSPRCWPTTRAAKRPRRSWSTPKPTPNKLLVRHRPSTPPCATRCSSSGELVGEEILDVIRAAILRDELKSIDFREQHVD